MNPTSPDAAARLASALALVTTLTAAAETTAAIAARRRGDLPSGTRARADVRADLDAARADADALLRQVARSALVVDAASLDRTAASRNLGSARRPTAAAWLPENHHRDIHRYLWQIPRFH